jgi:threonine dehydrogenase-like Zn-dependent dehydrogenase
VRGPFADVGCAKIPDGVSNEQAITVTDVFPTAYFGMDMAGVHIGDTVAVFGLGPVGQMGVLSARMLGAKEIIAVDRIPARLNMASWQGAKTIDFSKHDPVDAIRDVTGGQGVDVALEAVGFEASCGAGSKAPLLQKVKGECPEQTLDWLMECTRKAGSIAAVGIFASQPINHVRFGEAFKKNLRVHTGSCPHMKYIPRLLETIRSGQVDPSFVITHRASIDRAPDMYKLFSDRSDGCVKVMLACA